MPNPQREVGQPKGLLNKKDDLIPWIMQAIGERGLSYWEYSMLKIDYEPSKWAMGRELEPTIGKTHTCRSTTSDWRWPLFVISLRKIYNDKQSMHSKTYTIFTQY